ncbi:Uncharacterized protein HZ326_12228 [Fusarium oxysporum f. sp. albedinis]|jgi:hypothetical protein|nr:Uncharacterized protein HZ326_12228 [Fusarium oxysporum f. sp. albedinis]
MTSHCAASRSSTITVVVIGGIITKTISMNSCGDFLGIFIIPTVTGNARLTNRQHLLISVRTREEMTTIEIDE